jgi:hypothetical protein
VGNAAVITTHRFRLDQSTRLHHGVRRLDGVDHRLGFVELGLRGVVRAQPAGIARAGNRNMTRPSLIVAPSSGTPTSASK